MSWKNDIFRTETTFCKVEFEVDPYQLLKEKLDVLWVVRPCSIVYVDIMNKYILRIGQSNP